MAACTLSLAEEDLLPAQLGGGGLGWVQFAVPSQLGRWREVENLLKFRHRMHLASALQYIGAFLCRNHLIAIEVGGSLLELRKVLNRLQGPLGTEEPLNVQAAQCRSFNAMAKLLWPDIAHQAEGAIGAAIRMAVQARHPAARLLRAPVDCFIELLLRKRSQQQPQAFNLLRVQNAGEHIVVVVDGDQLPLGHVAKIRPRGEVHCRGKLRQKALRNIEVQIEARQVAVLLFQQFLNFLCGKYHAALRMVGMWQRQKALGEDTLFTDIVGGHLRKLVPRHASRQLHSQAFLDRLCAVHDNTLCRAVAQIVALRQQVHLPQHDRCFRGGHAVMHRSEALLVVHRHIAVLDRLRLLAAGRYRTEAKEACSEETDAHHADNFAKEFEIAHHPSISEPWRAVPQCSVQSEDYVLSSRASTVPDCSKSAMNPASTCGGSRGRRG